MNSNPLYIKPFGNQTNAVFTPFSLACVPTSSMGNPIALINKHIHVFIYINSLVIVPIKELINRTKSVLLTITEFIYMTSVIIKHFTQVIYINPLMGFMTKVIRFTTWLMIYITKSIVNPIALMGFHSRSMGFHNKSLCFFFNEMGSSKGLILSQCWQMNKYFTSVINHFHSIINGIAYVIEPNASVIEQTNVVNTKLYLGRGKIDWMILTHPQFAMQTGGELNALQPIHTHNNKYSLINNINFKN